MIFEGLSSQGKEAAENIHIYREASVSEKA